MRIVILIVLVIFGLAAVACTSEAPSPSDTQTASTSTPDVPATVEAGVIATREAETAIDATVEAKVAAALTAPTPTTAAMPTATPRPTSTPRPTAAPDPTATPYPTPTPAPTPTPTLTGSLIDDHGNDFESATRIAIGEAVAVELENLDDREVFAFRARPGTEYVLTLNWETYEIWENPGSIMDLYDAGGGLLARLNDYDFSEQRTRNTR